MYGRTRYIVIILAVVLLFLLGILIFRGGKKPVPIVHKGPTQLVDYVPLDSYVRLTINGPVNANENHRMVRITVGPNFRTFDTYQGYEYTVLKTQGYDNNGPAYDDFLHALQLAGFDRTRKTKQTNDLGQCPLGDRFIFELFNDNEQVSRRWSSTCGTIGTYGGKTTLSVSLFKAQIPNYNSLISGVKL